MHSSFHEGKLSERGRQEEGERGKRRRRWQQLFHLPYLSCFDAAQRVRLSASPSVLFFSCSTLCSDGDGSSLRAQQVKATAATEEREEEETEERARKERAVPACLRKDHDDFSCLTCLACVCL